jgi:hypothetical protein
MPTVRDRRHAQGMDLMLDAIVLGMGIGFLALSAAYTLACDRL